MSALRTGGCQALHRAAVTQPSDPAARDVTAHYAALAARANEPFVLPPREFVPIYHDIVLKACREVGFVPNAPHEADHLQLMLGMVAEGSGVALSPASAWKMKQHRLAFAALRPPVAPLEVVVAWRREPASPDLCAEPHRPRRDRRASNLPAPGVAHG